MKIGILSLRASLYSTRRLLEAARDRGHQTACINYLRCYMDITSRKPRVLYGGQALSLDAVVPRIGASYTFYGAAVVRQFEMMRVFTANGSQAISRARDKLRSFQILAREGIDLPVTTFAHSIKDVDDLIEIAGVPVVVKLLEGTQGMGVVLAETKSAARSVVAAFRQLDANILVQEFIKEAGGSDIRAFVVGRRVVAAMERQAAEGEFRSNLHRGGTAKPIKITSDERAIAIRAARSLGLYVAGVDMIRSERGTLVLEVNASPGLEGIETTTGVDVAGAIVEFLEKNASLGKMHDRITDKITG
jgi:ribosomal protein S6--L-glutamate ligase